MSDICLKHKRHWRNDCHECDKEQLGATVAEHKPNPITLAKILEKIQVGWRNWKVRKTGRAYRRLCKAMEDDPDYARTFHANISMLIYDLAIGRGIDHRKAIEESNQCADRIMRYVFAVTVSCPHVNPNPSRTNTAMRKTRDTE